MHIGPGDVLRERAGEVAVDLTLLAEHRRGCGALYGLLNHSPVDAGGLRRALAALPQSKAADNRLVLAGHPVELCSGGVRRWPAKS